MIEKHNVSSYNRSSSKKFNFIKSIALVLLSSIALYSIHFNCLETPSEITLLKLAECPDAEIYRPKSYDSNKDVLYKIINDETFRNKSVVKMQNAVRIDTSSYDDLPIDVSKNLEKFQHFNVFHKQLREDFPLLHQTLELHMVNHFGLVYIWKGSDESLQPLLLMGHQDVVPINEDSLDQWDHPPFSADYDGKYLYGRGSGDCKNLVIGNMEGVEELIKVGFKPRRTVILSYGFDEEITGIRNKNAEFIESIYGKKSIYAVMDEGGVSLSQVGDSTMAIVGTGEKGYLDLSLAIQKKGGHSSIPQDHTAIGMMGDLIVQIENDKYPTYFTQYNPTFYQYVCYAENAVDIDEHLKHDILYSQVDELSNLNVRNYINSDRVTSYAIKTTQALDMIQGGVKVNALPEFVELKINSRVALEENITIAYDKFVKDAKVIADKYDLGLYVQFPYSNDTIEFKPPTDVGILTVKPINILEPSPVTTAHNSKWQLFAGTTRHVYEEIAYPEKYIDQGKRVIVTPGLGTGNTDTKLYWNLTDTIYRYRPGVLPSVLAGSHGINEYIEYDGHLQIIAFTFEYIQSVDESDD
ncbi:hypothetical protein C6P40_005071 [Pichia californica]|uniref:Peptidase M20 dimerisation domain-containing protein n=1 Tax=Pichia californica TaxID=460514 RepID=A0A9P6WPG0_9ASCO|nr:hypothetical protein C6P42_005366 [[Candida] californica]KAG0689423.1 hypothetical protein C6P40_005071 [[Candida] californica]